MIKQNIGKAVHSIRGAAKRDMPGILTGMGIAGMGASIILAVRETPKVEKLLDEATLEKGEELTVKEKVKVSWKPFAKPAATFIFSAACIVASDHVSNKRIGKWAGACQLGHAIFSDYKQSVQEVVGEKKNKEIEDKFAEKRLENDPKNPFDVLPSTPPNGKMLCYDAVVGRYFYSDHESIKRGVNNFNKTVLSEDYASLNELHAEWGMPPTEIGDIFGQHVDFGLLEVCFSSQLAYDHKPCLVVTYDISPGYHFQRTY